MTVKELVQKLACADSNAVVKFGYCEYDIGDIVVTMSEDGKCTVVLTESKKKTEKPTN